jgi:ABC-type transport system involved in multi-copper enzyme maturation permease subunit
VAQTQDAAPQRTGPKTEKSTADVIQDIWQLTKDYARQETVDPLKALGKFVGLGLAGAVVLGLGLMFLSLAILRALQTQTDGQLDGYLSVVPYIVTLLFALLGAALAARAINRTRKKESRS